MNRGTCKAERQCPKCGKRFTEYPAISRRNNTTEICSQCGRLEAIADMRTRTIEDPNERARETERIEREILGDLCQGANG